MASKDEGTRAPEDSANARNEDQPEAERFRVKTGYVLATLALCGLCLGAVVAVVGDTGHVSIGGGIAAISAGLLAATAMVGTLVVFHRKHTPAEVTEPKGGSADSGSGKSRTSKPTSPKRPTPRAAART